MVVGGGIAGLTAALLLGRRGHRVFVIEQEPVAAPASLADARWWWRSSAPQVAHSHVFPARCRELLAAEAPDVLAALRRAKVTEVKLTKHVPSTLTGPVEADPRLVALASRRSVFEWVLRRAVLSERSVTMLSGLPATGLVVRYGSTPQVTAITLAAGQRIDADLVIDAAGRHSPVSDWLVAAGGPTAPTVVVPGGVTTFTRFYEPRTGRKGPVQVLSGASDGYTCRLVPADAGAFAVTFEVYSDNRWFRELIDGVAFDRAAAAMPGMAEWLDPSVARRLTRVARLASDGNRLQRLTSDGRPVVAGVLPVGDAVCATTPGDARGVTVAILSAVRLVQAVDAHPGVGPQDAEARTLAMDASIGAELAPWFHDSVQRAARRTDPEPDEAGSAVGEGQLTHAELALAARRDPQLWTALARLENMLVLPSAVLADPDVVQRARAVFESDWRPEPDGVPSHDELVAVLAAGRPEPARRRESAGRPEQSTPGIPRQRLATTVA